jgi:hypothetical protein
MKKKQLIIIFLLAFSLAGCAKNGPATVNTSNNTIKPNDGRSSSDLFADWKTYNDSKYGINLKQPADWECKVETDQTPSRQVAARVLSCNQTNRNKIGTVPSININIMTVFNENDPVEWLKSNYGIPKEAPQSVNFEVAGVKGIKYSYKEGNPPTIPEIEGIKLVFIKNKKLFHIYCHIDEEGEQKNNIENILKSITVD